MIASAFAMDLMKGSDGLWKVSDRKALQKCQGDCSVSGMRDPVALINFSASTLYGNGKTHRAQNCNYIIHGVLFNLSEHNCWQPESQPIRFHGNFFHGFS